MSSNQEIPNSNHNNSIRLDGGAAVCGAPLSDGALFFNGLSAGPDVGQARNASPKASGGAYGSERSVCWAKSGNGQINASVNNNNIKSSSNNSSNINSTLRSAAPAHIELKSVAFENGSAGRGGVSFGHQINNNNNGNIIINKNNNNQEIVSSTYPPSPPADDAECARQLGSSDVPAAKPLTMANVSTLATAGASAAATAAVVGGSPFSAISTSPTTDEDDGESSEEEGDSASEISFSSNSSVSSSSIGNNHNNITSVTSSNATNKDHQFLASVFGAGYLDSFTKLGVQVILPSNDVFPAELGLKGAAVLSAPQQGTKTLYLSPKEMEKLDSETLVELLEIADEDLECSALVIALERKSKEEDNETLAETLHALMYVGGAIVAPDAGVVKYDSEKFILVGLDL